MLTSLPGLLRPPREGAWCLHERRKSCVKDFIGPLRKPRDISLFLSHFLIVDSVPQGSGPLKDPNNYDMPHLQVFLPALFSKRHLLPSQSCFLSKRLPSPAQRALRGRVCHVSLRLPRSQRDPRHPSVPDPVLRCCNHLHSHRWHQLAGLSGL